ncbi:MAG: ankyrin repeat domain-containing protein [Lewinella sp.]
MNAVKFTSLAVALSLTLALIFLTFACNEADKNTNAEPPINQPKIDIQAAIMSDRIDIVKQHIEAGTDLNQQEQMSGSTPLITATTFGKTAIASALIEANADLSIKNNDGATALHTAAFFCRIEIVQMLLDAKADKTIKNNFGATPRESVMGSFAEIKPFYEMLQQQLSPLGLQLDLNEIETTRPVVAMMLQ